jgi:hypothetical protein
VFYAIGAFGLASGVFGVGLMAMAIFTYVRGDRV